MAYRKVLLGSARQEYREIIEYLVDVLKNSQAAVDFMDEFDHQFDLIARDPELYALSSLPELAGRGYRRFLAKKYLVLYRIQGDRVVIAHIFHQSQDYARLV